MKKQFITALGLLSLLFASCSHDATEDLGVVPAGDTFTMRVNVEGAAHGATRATVDPVTGEENVNSLYLLFFSPSTDRSGEFQGSIKLDGPLQMNEDIRVDMSGTGLSSTDDYKILAVANIDSYAPYLGVSVTEWLAGLQGMTENNVYKLVMAYIAADEQIDIDKLIMTGEVDKPAGGISTMRLTLTRGLVRFDVVNSARESYDLVSVSIWNAFPETSMFGGGLVDYSKGRIQRFYGIDNITDPSIPAPSDGNGDCYGDIFGHLYSLPNQVITPGEKDDKTTCLIVGLIERGQSNVTYHRVNINAEDAMQNLKRNNAYRLTIRSVSGDGADSEIEAYTGGVNNINYKINYWDLDDDGLIQQNGNIILGIPTKRIRLGAEAEERSYDIFAFGGAPGEQIAVSTSFDGTAGSYIKVTQSGNTITVKADALTSDEERTGTINITYGGLTATIGIIQSGTAAQFLRVITPDGKGIPTYPGFAGAPMDGTLTVEASGAWKAEIFQFGGGDYFSFNQLAAQRVYNSTDLTADLKIYTIAENSTGASRQAFVLITLVADEDNYNSALVLTQRTLGSINIAPDIKQVDWDGLGKLTTTGGGSSDTEFRFNVVTTLDVNNEYEEWEAILTDGSAYFEIVGSTWDKDNLANNYVTVKAKGETTDGARTGKLRVQLKASPSTGIDVTLKQTGYTMGLSPDAFNAISSKGGATGAITVTTNGTGLTWSAEVNGTVAAGDALTGGHAAAIVDATTGSALTAGTKYALTQKFKVQFPKLMYGNHLKGDVTATVTVKLWSGANEVGEQVITVKQNELKPNPVSILNVHGTGYPYGALSSSGTYADSYRMVLRTFFTNSGDEAAVYPASTPTVKYLYSPGGVSIPSSNVSTVSSVSATTTFLHASNFGRITSPSTAYAAMDSWLAADNGVMFVVQDRSASSGTDATIFTNSNSTLRKLGWSRSGDVNTASKVPNTGSSAKIVDFIFRKGPFGPVNGLSSSNFASDGVSNRVSVSGSAVAILGTSSGASFVIDPKNRVVFVGESQMFSHAGAVDGISVTGYPSTSLNAKTTFLANVYAYMILTAQYGSSFSDLFID